MVNIFKKLKYIYLSMNFIFSIEGNIGSGKSTLVDILKNHVPKIDMEHFKFIYLQEPVDEWKEIKN